MQLVKSEQPKKNNLIRGQPYMAWVKVTPYYEANNSIPIMCRFNEIIPRKPKEEKQEDKALYSTLKQEEEL